MKDDQAKDQKGKPDKPDKQVKISVDNHPKHVEPGTYVVSDFKTVVGVPADKDLDQVIDGKLTTLDDGAKVTIVGGEVFFSHVRRGGAS